MPNPPTTEMGRVHETHVAEVLGGHKTKSSGNQWDDQTDGGHAHDDPFAFRWDGKSTKGKSITLTLDMLAKIAEQAQGERPAIPLLWYGNEKLTVFTEDWIAVRLMDFSEVLEAARESAELCGQIDELRGQIAEVQVRSARATARLDQVEGAAEELGESGLDGLREALDRAETRARLAEEQESQLRRRVQELEGALARQAEMRGATIIADEAGVLTDPRRAVPGYVPALPWTVVSTVHISGMAVTNVIRYDAQGHQGLSGARQVRIERSANNRPRLFVDDQRVRDGDLYVDGKLRARCWQDQQDRELG